MIPLILQMLKVRVRDRGSSVMLRSSLVPPYVRKAGSLSTAGGLAVPEGRVQRPYAEGLAGAGGKPSRNERFFSEHGGTTEGRLGRGVREVPADPAGPSELSPRLLARVARNLSGGPRAVLLGAQDCERPEPAADTCAEQGQMGFAGGCDLECHRRSPACRAGVRCFPAPVRREIRESGGMLGQGSEGAADVLRLPPPNTGRASAPLNPIKPTFATIRYPTRQTRSCMTQAGMLHMICKLGRCAESRWQRLRGYQKLAKVIQGVPFQDGLEWNQRDGSTCSEEPVAA